MDTVRKMPGQKLCFRCLPRQGRPSVDGLVGSWYLPAFRCEELRLRVLDVEDVNEDFQQQLGISRLLLTKGIAY